MPTLSVSEITNDVLQAFKKRVPALNRMGTNFNVGSLKLNKTYYSHIPTLPSVDDVSTTYATTGQTARSLLVDVPVVVNKHKAVLLTQSHFDSIKDDKNKYDDCIRNAGYALAKAFIDDILTGVTSQNFSQSSTYAASDCDVDMLTAVTTALNTQGAANTGRQMLINSTAAGYLSIDSRMNSRDFLGKDVTGEGYRRWDNAYGFESIIEYPDLPTNNGTALTSVTAEADDDLFTKAAHGLVTGQRVVLTAMTSVVGVTVGVAYYVIAVSSSTFKLASTRALAVAGTGLDITTDGTAGTITPTENLAAFAFDPRAIAIVAGIPDDFNSEFFGNIPRTMGFDPVTDPETGLSMAGVSWQDVGTGKLNLAVTFVWGKSLGTQSGATAAGGICDYAGHRIITA